VPHLYPRDRPALERAMPADDVPGGQYRADRRTWLVLFGDGDWHPVTVKAWRADRRGREVVDIEFWDAAELATRTGSYVVDRQKVREG
jgi:hypothetical protein